MIEFCMNHSLLDTNCTVSSADLDPSDGINTFTVTSSELYVPITSDTYDTEDNRSMTSQPAHTQATSPDSTGLIAAVAAVIIALLGILVVIILLVKKRYCSNVLQ